MYHFIVNPSSSSGHGAVIWKELEERLIRERVPYIAYLTQKGGDAKRFASEISSGSEPVTIVVCGGDGTMNEVVCGITDYEKVTLASIPCGSSNDLNRDMGLSSDPLKLLDEILNPTEVVKMDIGKLSCAELTKNFSVSMGIGFDAAICHEALKSTIKDTLNKIKLGKLTYLGIALKQLMNAEKIGCSIILDDEKTVHVEQVLFVTGMVHRYEGGGFKFCPEANYSDGLLDVLVVGDLSKGKVLRVLPKALKGEHIGTAGINMYRCKKFVVKADAPMAVHVDGESAGYQKEVLVTQEDKQVNFIVK